MKNQARRKGKSSQEKSILRLPDLEVAKTAVINSLSCPDAQRGYRHAIDEFVNGMLRAAAVVQQDCRGSVSNASGIATPCAGNNQLPPGCGASPHI